MDYIDLGKGGAREEMGEARERQRRYGREKRRGGRKKRGEQREGEGKRGRVGIWQEREIYREEGGRERENENLRIQRQRYGQIMEKERKGSEGWVGVIK